MKNNFAHMDASTAYRIAVSHDGVDAVHDRLIRSGHSTSRVVQTPNAFIWPPDWDEMIAAGVVEDYVDRMKAAGLDNINLATITDTEVRDSVQGLLNDRNMERMWVAAFAWPRAGDENPSYQHIVDWDAHPDVLDQFRRCPNQREEIFFSRMNFHRAQYDFFAPMKYFLMSAEYWFPPDWMLEADSDFTQDIIDDCELCQGTPGYFVGWRDAFDYVREYIRSKNSETKVYSFRDYKYLVLPTPTHITFDGLEDRRSLVSWPGVGDAPSPRMYTAQFNGADWMEGTLQYNDVSGGYPWLTGWDSTDFSAGNIFSGSEFYDFCAVIAKGGAKGFCLWPGPNRSDEGLVVGSAKSEAFFSLIDVGIRAFKDNGSRFQGDT